jgi:hypothetical protein
MVEMRVRQENVERFRLHVFRDAIETGAGIEDHADLGQHEARRLATVVRVVASRSEENELHGRRRGEGRRRLVL